MHLDGISLELSIFEGSAVVDLCEANFTRWLIVLRGSARATVGTSSVDLNLQRSCVCSPNLPLRLECGPDYQHLELRIAPAKLNETLESMLGVKLRGKLVFAPEIAIEDLGAPSLQQFAAYLVKQADGNKTSLPPPMVRAMQHTLLVSFLCVARHNFSARLDKSAPDSAPDYVRAAEEYIEASWDRAITVNDLLKVANIGVRSLFKAFRRHRGCSPISFAKTVRLNRARAMLSQGPSSRSVASVANACGFANLGHFARDYRHQHGELPSATLAKSKTR